MKPAILIVLGLIFNSISFGQDQIKKEVSNPVEYNTTINATTNVRPVVSTDRAAGDIVWSNDFSNASDWTATGPSTNFSNNGWTIGTTTNGWYFGTAANMGTTGNFARFTNGDPNIAGDVIQNGPFTLEYTTPINLSNVPSPQIEFSQYGARFITLQSVQVSTNGGVTWTEVGNNNDILPLTSTSGSAYGQPEIRSYNIASAIAGNPSNVTIRFFWDGALNGGNLNYIDYGWFVDDVKIIEGSLYDAEITAGYFNSAGYEYYMVPQSQITSIELVGEVYNNGDSTHTGLHLVGSVDMAGNVFTGTSTNVDLPPGGIDTMEVTTLFTPTSGLGDYDITWTFVGNNAEDIIAGNDTIIDAIEVTNTMYGRDNNIPMGSIGNVTTNSGLSFEIGNVMQTFGTSYMNKLDIHVSTLASNAGKLIYGTVYKWDGFTYNLVVQTFDHLIVAADLGNFVTIALPSSIPITNGEEYLVCAGHYGGNPEVQFSTAQSTFPNTVLGYSANGQLFSLLQPRAIMIRVDLTNDITTNQTINICDGQSFNAGSSTYTTSGTYIDVLVAANGNDSIINTELIVSPTYYDTVDVEICDGDVYTIGTSTYSSAGYYTDALQMTGTGCDSTVVTNLSVTQPIDVNVSISNLLVLFADLSGADYQWVDCDVGNQPIPNATQQFFEPVVDGNYAVLITVDGCTKMSACTQVIGLGLEEFSSELYSIYPNPIQQSFTLEMADGFNKNYSVLLVDQMGKIIFRIEHINDKKYEFNNLKLANGIYYVEVYLENQKIIKKLAVNN